MSWSPREKSGLDLCRGRGRAGLQQFLNEFSGVLQTDGYQVYKDPYPEQIQRMACMAHVRRKFFDAQTLGTQNLIAQEILEMIQQFYHLEREARELGLSTESRLQLREQKSQPLMSELKITATWQKALPKSALGKACEYALGQWPALETFLKNGVVEIDNNRCEQGIRPIALGRKNWMHIGSHATAPQVHSYHVDLGNLQTKSNQHPPIPPRRVARFGRSGRSS